MPHIVPVALLLLALVLGGCASPPSPPALAPALQPGDHWELRTTSAREGSETATTTRIEVEGIEPVSARVPGVAGALRLRSETESTTTRDESRFDTRATSTAWLRPSDLAKLASVTEVGTSAPSATPSAAVSTLRFDPPCASMPWPLEVGTTHAVECTAKDASEEGGAGSLLSYSWTVVREERVSVPAGTFEAFVLEGVAEGARTVHWVAPAACGIVRTDVGPEGRLPVTTELVSFSCASASGPT